MSFLPPSFTTFLNLSSVLSAPIGHALSNLSLPRSFVNHTLANLRKDDINPVSMVHQSPAMQGQIPGFTRDESLAWARKVQEELTGKKVEEGEKRED